MHILDAAYHVIHDYPGGADSLGPRIGKSGVTLSHEAKRTGAAKLGLDTALKVSVLTGDRRILDAFALACDCMVVPLPGAGSSQTDPVMMGLAQMLAEQAEVVKAVSSSLDDGVISQNERDGIYREVSKLLSITGKLLEDVEAKHAADQAARQGGAA